MKKHKCRRTIKYVVEFLGENVVEQVSRAISHAVMYGEWRIANYDDRCGFVSMKDFNKILLRLGFSYKVDKHGKRWLNCKLKP